MMGSPFRMHQALAVCLWCPYLDVDGPLIETLQDPLLGGTWGVMMAKTSFSLVVLAIAASNQL